MKQEEIINGKTVENKREDRKALPGMILFVIIGLVVGLIMGIGSSTFKVTFADTIATTVKGTLNLIAPYANVVLTLVVFIVNMVLYGIAKKQTKAWDGEDEKEYDRIDGKLSIAIVLASINMILSFFFFAVGSEALDDTTKFDPYDMKTVFAIVCYLGGFVLALVLTTMEQMLVVNLTKVLNPEKKGSIYDNKFHKKWEESCDEAEKLQIYKGGYYAYKASGSLCIGLWLFCLVGKDIWNFGLMPVTIVTIMWLVQLIAYCIGSAKKSK